MNLLSSLGQGPRRCWAVWAVLGVLCGHGVAVGAADATFSGSSLAVRQEVIAPELLCALRVSDHTLVLRERVSADPYASAGQAVTPRFRFKAVLLGNASRIEHLTLTVIDTEPDGDPSVLQQARWADPVRSQGSVLQSDEAWRPALTGWQRVYSPHLGRELAYGCALVAPGASPSGVAVADATVPFVLPSKPSKPPASGEPGETVRIAWMGDVMLADGPGRTIRRGGDPFAPFDARLKQADVRIANLECVIATKGTALAKPWTFRAHPRVLPVLQKHVDLVSLANNHSGDFGRAAFVEMLDRLDRAGLPHVGGGRNLREAHRFHVIERKGLRIAVLGYNEMFPRVFEAGSDSPGVAWSEDEQVLFDIAQAKQAADIVIPFMHWGQEHDERAHDRQRTLARRMIEAGADAVVGTHPHVIQDTETILGKPVIYSLGNFVFDGFSSAVNNTGALLWLELNRQGVQAWHLETAHIDPQGTPHPDKRRGL